MSTYCKNHNVNMKTRYSLRELGYLSDRKMNSIRFYLYIRHPIRIIRYVNIFLYKELFEKLSKKQEITMIMKNNPFKIFWKSCYNNFYNNYKSQWKS